MVAWNWHTELGPAREALREAPGRLAERPASLLALACAAADGEPLDLPDQAALARVRRETGRLVRLETSLLRDALDTILVAPSAAQGLRWLLATGGLGTLLPEARALAGFHETSTSRHKDLWEHTLQVVEQTPADVDLRWVALMHDTGKVAARSTGGASGTLSFWRHEWVSAWLWRGVAARLEMPRLRVERVDFVITHHARVNAYRPTWSDAAVARLMRESGARLADLVAFSGSDVTTRRAAQAARIRSYLEHLGSRLGALSQAASAPRRPRGLGARVRDDLGLAGPALGEALRWLDAELQGGRLRPDASAQECVAAIARRQNRQ